MSTTNVGVRSEALTTLLANKTAGSPALVVTIILAGLIVICLRFFEERSQYPLANPPRWYQIRFFKQLEFLTKGSEILSETRKRYGDKPYRLLTELGEVLVLPPGSAQLIRNEEQLDFSAAITDDFYGHLPGFEPYALLQHDGQVVQTLVRKQLTKHLSIVSEPLSSEATFAARSIFGDDTEWKGICIRRAMLDLVARLSSRIFLGAELCRNQEWLDITKSYTVNSFAAALRMKLVPQFLVVPYSWLSSDCKRVRQNLKDAEHVITPYIERRRSLKAAAESTGTPLPEFDDAIEWAEQESKGVPYSPSIMQLLLSFAAIHTTSDLLTQTMLRLANKPESITLLRKEIVDVIRSEGLGKSALFHMKLLDSALKEAQRIKPNSFLVMRRLATQRIVLPGGIVIRMGERVAIDAVNMVSPELYSHPEEYDIFRFLRMREDPKTANKAHLVSTSPDHLTFGHGIHACPGRFFAANETKIALCHLLLKYDWKLADGASLAPVHTVGVMTTLDPANKLLYRRRKEEVELDHLLVSSKE
ncbi:hypothetical protein CKM354_001216100 [Cercospora kikuchii]|uniref:Cytochrome P450 monooxygenase n=1 Tax=Cercospora kikuchii TaxID=84275 RepID=A0A9P3L2A9_9PEZI|nr:uncharacterized protein CKM354_001216100 [Cercospora kikuchii]GIZ49122.1 hypothetical protein CKM354_001216100 [Cercospora kikuchii]